MFFVSSFSVMHSFSVMTRSRRRRVTIDVPPMREAVIVASSRTPLAKSHRGSFNLTRPDDLAAHAIRHALAKVPQTRSEGG